jgi:hypothetical protein
VTYEAVADSPPFRLISSRESGRRSFADDYGRGTLLLITPGMDTNCKNVRTNPVCTSAPYSGPDGPEREGISPIVWLAEDDIQRAGETNSINGVSSQVVVGRQAACVTIDGPTVTRRLTDGSKGVSGTVCIDRATGVLLSWQTSKGTPQSDQASLVATKVEAPTEADFKLPGRTS